MFEEEKNVLDKAPVSDVLMDDLSKEVKEKKKKSHINTNYILVVSDFYYLDSANNLRDDLIKKTDVIQKYVPERSLVFLISKNTVAPLICYIASIRNNCIVMLVDVKTSRADILNLVETYKPSFLVVPINWFENSTTDGLTILENIYDYSIYRTNYQKLPKMNNDLSVLLPTSGSMGSPKYVRLSHQNLKAHLLRGYYFVRYR